MKQILTIIAIAISSIAFSQTPINFVTLGVQVPVTPKQNVDGSWDFNCTAFYGVENCPYTIKRSNDWVGFVSYADLSIHVAPTKDTDVLSAVALDSADAYRKRNYPNIK